jgi:cation:H+ antiporter
MIPFLLLIAGLFCLWLGTELTVRNATSLASHLGLSDFFIGMTILAFGTDLLELIVTVNGALHNLRGDDSSGIVVGNAIGSSVSQISVVIGVAALASYLTIASHRITNLAIELIGSTLLLFLVSIDGSINWNDGAILILAFCLYFFSLIRRENQSRESTSGQPTLFPGKTGWKWAALLLGLGVVILGSELVLDSGIQLAERWGVRQSFVGAILIGLGSSLPELAISIGAVIRGKPSLTIGNVIGSNIFDLLIPLGVASLLAEIRVPDIVLIVDLPYLFFISILVVFFLNRERGLQRNEGISLLLLYILYVALKWTT